jgi:hypothetical protein
MTCYKSKKQREVPSILKLVDFQNKQFKNTLSEYKDIEFINYYQNKYSNANSIKKKKQYLAIFKIKDLVLKCYSQLFQAYYNGLSIRKVLSKYNLNNLPTFEKSIFNLKNRRSSSFR